VADAEAWIEQDKRREAVVHRAATALGRTSPQRTGNRRHASLQTPQTSQHAVR
jgi:hypothetical protein